MIEEVRFRTVELSDAAFESGGLRLATVKSRALGRRADVSFWAPEAEEIGTLLILLHGVYGSHWVWSGKAGVHRTAQAMLGAGEIGPMVIAMPSDGLGRDGSGYLDWPGGEDVERWIVDEMPALAVVAVPALRRDARIAIAGLSMGGYGALRLGAKYAGRFHAISAHSAITEIGQMRGFAEEPAEEYLLSAARAELSPLDWMRRERKRLPPVRFDCGVGDDLLAGNRALDRALTAEGIAHEYAEFDGGHEWSYWRRHIGQTLRFVDRHCSREKEEVR